MCVTVTRSFPPIHVFSLGLLHWPLLLHSLKNFQCNSLPFSSLYKSTSWAFWVTVLLFDFIHYLLNLNFLTLLISQDSKPGYFPFSSEYIYCLTYKVLQPQDVKRTHNPPQKMCFSSYISWTRYRTKCRTVKRLDFTISQRMCGLHKLLTIWYSILLRLLWQNDTHLTSGGWKCRVTVPTHFSSGKGLLLAATFLLDPNMLEQELSVWPLLIKS